MFQISAYARSKQIGQHKKYLQCRFCFSDLNGEFINLGVVPLAGGFLRILSKRTEKEENFYPLELAFCTKCLLVQSINTVEADLLFKDYFYHSSKINTLVEHFDKTAGEVVDLLGEQKKRLIVEIGCNDGSFLSAIQKRKHKAVGIDPAKNIVTPLIKKGWQIINAYFSEKAAKAMTSKFGKASAICSFNTFAHIEDMHDVIKGVKVLLDEDGFLLFEVHYLGNLLEQTQYDMIYHEHQYYYSLLALINFFRQYDMEVFDVQSIPIHAGSMRYFVKNKSSKKYIISSSVESLLKKEKRMMLDRQKTYRVFLKDVKKSKNDLLILLNKLKKRKLRIAGYGASGRGTMIMNYCGLDKKYLDYIVDDSPAKQHAFIPGVHLPVYPSKTLYGAKKPDYVLLFAWSFYDEIIKKHKKFLQDGGKFIVPLPKVKIINK